MQQDGTEIPRRKPPDFGRRGEVEEVGYNVMKDQDGGACEVLHYSDGEVVAHVTIWPIKNEDDKAEEDEDEPSI